MDGGHLPAPPYSVVNTRFSPFAIFCSMESGQLVWDEGREYYYDSTSVDGREEGGEEEFYGETNEQFM